MNRVPSCMAGDRAAIKAKLRECRSQGVDPGAVCMGQEELPEE